MYSADTVAVWKKKIFSVNHHHQHQHYDVVAPARWHERVHGEGKRGKGGTASERSGKSGWGIGEEAGSGVDRKGRGDGDAGEGKGGEAARGVARGGKWGWGD